METAQIAVQCYTLREHLRSAAEFAASMRRVREIGYRAVQISGVGPIPAREIRLMTDAEGLTVCASQEPALDILERPEAVVERLQMLGTLTAYPLPRLALSNFARLTVEPCSSSCFRAPILRSCRRSWTRTGCRLGAPIPCAGVSA